LTAGQRYAIRLEQTKGTDAGVAKLLWSSPSTPQQVVPTTQLYPADEAPLATYNDDAPQIAHAGRGAPAVAAGSGISATARSPRTWTPRLGTAG
jgi:hypothetical protein